ncbi:hypothetical protein [Corynebacterium aquatimens]|uniref:Secreted protein n=1 Tax=Corynebacterium aquatimens TaxID=1190508 RepID=A0A931DX31_9CORY|nr:hypothetical protein [Corynebacterium aquatimens]MBG6121700.1 hypothetical protein [Corynebacterium aquatimens]WJY65761.1 hypothetical protein CAQUA_05265 [Corynebacterium aquatimens]
MRKFIAAFAAAVTVLAGASTATATASEWKPAWNPRGVEWPAGYRQLPKVAPHTAFSNPQNTVRCGVYEFDGQTFVQCLSLVDTMPGHQCNQKYGEANAMNSVTGDAWNCLPKNTFNGAPAMGPLQVRYYGNQFVFSDPAGNFFIGDRGLNRVIRVGTVNDVFVQDRHINGLPPALRGSSIPAGSSI